jgi:jumonji domain-containing protein 2
VNAGRYGVVVHKMVQEQRDMMVVFPHAYHAGFNHGFNMAEAVNFALPR